MSGTEKNTWRKRLEFDAGGSGCLTAVPSYIACIVSTGIPGCKTPCEVRCTDTEGGGGREGCNPEHVGYSNGNPLLGFPLVFIFPVAFLFEQNGSCFVHNLWKSE